MNITDFETPPNPQPKVRRNRVAVAGSAVAMLIIVVAAALYGYGRYEQYRFRSRVPASIRQEVTFPIYLPNAGSTEVKSESIMYSNDILRYTSTFKGESINVTQQAKTDGFDLAKFATSTSLTGAELKEIPLGSQLTGTLNGRDIAIIDTGEVIITSTSTTTGPKPKATLQVISASLTEL